MADQPSSDLQDSLVAAKIEKLHLEIEKLKHPSRWAVVGGYVPSITTLIAVGGFIFTLWQAHQIRIKESEDREKARITNIQNQIRADKEQLLEYVTNEKIPVARVVVALGDLSTLVRQLPQSEAEIQQITSLLVFVTYELSFNEKRAVYFDVQALQRWPSYREYWKVNAGYHYDLISKKYVSPIARAYKQDPVCIQNLDYDGEKVFFTSTKISEVCQEGILAALLYGFQEHLKVIKEMPDLNMMEKEIAELNGSTEESALARRLEAYYLPPRAQK